MQQVAKIRSPERAVYLVRHAGGDDLESALLGRLAPLAIAVEPLTVPAQWSDLPPESVVVVSEASCADLSVRRHLLARPRTILITGRGAAGEVEATVRLLREHSGLSHVLAVAGDALPQRLALTVAHLLGMTPTGLAGYLTPDAAVCETLLRTTSDKQALVETITARVAAVAGFSELPRVVATIATELMTNAMFNAPHDAARRRPLYRDRPRQAPLQLGPGEEAAVAYGHDGHVFGLAVRDNFGMLNRETLVQHFSRSSLTPDLQIGMQTPGAGVGLYMVLSSAAQLDVHVVPGKRAEIVALVDLSKRYRDFAGSGHSFNLYAASQEEPK